MHWFLRYQAEKQTDAGENPTSVTAVGMTRSGTDAFFLHLSHNFLSTLLIVVIDSLLTVPL